MNKFWVGSLLCAFAFVVCGAEPKEKNSNRELAGFTIQVAPDFTWNSKTENAYRFLCKALNNFCYSLSDEQAKKIRQRPLSLSGSKGKSAVEYQKEKGEIVINDLLAFYQNSSTRNGADLITEFGREYYDLFLTEAEKEEVKKHFQASSLYKGKRAGRDPISFFSELTTSYFAVNSEEPRHYHLLRTSDPKGFNLMEKIWGKRGLKDFLCKEIEGFRVMYPIREKDAPDTVRALEAVQEDLETIVRVVPEPFVNLFRRKLLWLNNRTNYGAAGYHGNIQWLIQNNVLREKCRCVELCNMKNYYTWRKQNQPFMLLHEFAHMYHMSSYAQRGDIYQAYKNAMDKHLYEKVPLFTGSGYVKHKAYATTNCLEYFSELSEAYFGKNDFYPMNRDELKKHDPVGFKMIEHIWSAENYIE